MGTIGNIYRPGWQDQISVDAVPFRTTVGNPVFYSSGTQMRFLDWRPISVADESFYG